MKGSVFLMLVPLLLCQTSSPVKHSLRFFHAASSGFPNLPEFVVTVWVDGIQAGYCDANRRTEVKDAWKSFFHNNPELLTRFTKTCLGKLIELFKSRLKTFMQHHNHSEGVHTLQAIEGCDWDKKTEETGGVLQYNYDGDEFISLDLKNLMWVAPNPKAVAIKQEWDADQERIKSNDRVLLRRCPEWLKMFVSYWNSSLLRTVSLLQKSPSSPVSCHATGFYTNRVEMFWRKDGEEIHEDVDRGEILPNHDGTFQMSVDLNVSSVKDEDWSRYDCVIQMSGVETTRIGLDQAVIRTNRVPPSEFPAAGVGLVVGLMLLAVCITGFLVWIKKKKCFRLFRNKSSS